MFSLVQKQIIWLQSNPDDSNLQEQLKKVRSGVENKGPEIRENGVHFFPINTDYINQI